MPTGLEPATVCLPLSAISTGHEQHQTTDGGRQRHPSPSPLRTAHLGTSQHNHHDHDARARPLILALIAVYLACFFDYRRYLAPGERGTVLVIATNRQQARVIFRYVRALLTGVPMLAQMIEREVSESFDLTNSTTIEVGTTSFKTVRGYTIVAALCDEIAFWPTDDSAAQITKFSTRSVREW